MRTVIIFENKETKKLGLTSVSKSIKEAKELKIPDRFKNDNIYYFECCDLPDNEHTGSCCDVPKFNHADQIYIDKKKMCGDINWEVVLMPKEEISKKHVKRCMDNIEAELNKENPDIVKLIRLNHEKEKAKEFGKFKTPENAKLYEMALKNLQEDGHNKPKIIKKLQDKIKELS